MRRRVLPWLGARFGRSCYYPGGPAAEPNDIRAEIERLWSDWLLTIGPDVKALGPLVEAAAAAPKLRQLRPWVSMDRLCFSRWVDWPFSNDLPYAAPREGSFRVYAPRRREYLSERAEDILGEGTATQAVELLVAALPEPLEIVYRRGRVPS